MQKLVRAKGATWSSHKLVSPKTKSHLPEQRPVADQPWRNPRPAPHLPEVQPRLAQFLIPSWLRAWWPALLWAGGIFVMSTESFSPQHTRSVLDRILRSIDPSTPPAT